MTTLTILIDYLSKQFIVSIASVKSPQCSLMLFLQIMVPQDMLSCRATLWVTSCYHGVSLGSQSDPIRISPSNSTFSPNCGHFWFKKHLNGDKKAKLGFKAAGHKPMGGSWRVYTRKELQGEGIFIHLVARKTMNECQCCFVSACYIIGNCLQPRVL